jgi:hypothetical protein
MTANRLKSRLLLPAVTALIAMLVGAGAAQAAPTAPIKELLASHVGWEVNGTTKGNICTILSKDECQAAGASSEPVGFIYPEGIAVDNDPASPRYGNVFVADRSNYRVQELTAEGAFVAMFGREVNGTTKGNVCTAASGNVCKAGVAGVAAGQFGGQMTLADDPASGDVYVREVIVDFSNAHEPKGGSRVQKFTPEGKFVLEIGREVNETTKGNLCTEEEVEKAGVKCTGPALQPLGATTSEPGVFPPSTSLAVGGPKDLLYADGGNRVQMFEADGTYAGEIPLGGSVAESEVRALTVDEAGDVYLVHVGAGGSGNQAILKFNAKGEQIAEFIESPRSAGTPSLHVNGFTVDHLAVDSSGRLAVSGYEQVESGTFVQTFSGSYGRLLDSATGRLVTEYAVPSNLLDPEEVAGIGFNAGDELYAVERSGEENGQVLIYKPVPAGELLASAATCEAGAERETDATVTCTLKGEANPWGVAQTEVWFQWGPTELGWETPRQPVVEAEPGKAVKVHATVEGLLPNATYYYRQAGEDQNVKAPELLQSETTLLTTQPVAPRIVGEPSLPHAGPFSAVMFGEVNPENANTTYEFQYGSCENLESCPGIGETSPVESPAYGALGSTVEVGGLRPSTLYRYRLVAKSQAGEAKSGTGVFTTAPPPAVEAATEPAGAVTATSATVAGTVNPDGQTAEYAFELGVYNGAETQYGIVSSGSAGGGAVPVEESLALVGLQPGTQYAYRISAHSGNLTATGATLTFTTAGLPSVVAVPAVLAQLPVPDIAFPKEPANLTPKKLTRAQQLARALKACAKRPKSKRAGCRRSARKKYAASKTKAKKK